MKRRDFSGYHSFDYLEKKDYRHYELEKDIGWGLAEPYTVPLSKVEEERFERIVEKSIVLSLHDHLFTLPKAVRDRSELIAASRENRLPVSYEAVSRSCLDAVFDNGGNYLLMGGSDAGWKWDDCLCDLGMRLCDMQHQDFFVRCGNVSDVRRAHDEGKVAIIPSFESCTLIENELNRVEVLYGFGVRMLGITWSEANSLGCGLKETRDGGLTVFGHDVVERLNKIGMAIDIAHSGDQTSLDVIAASRKPVFISHAGARAVWNSSRMKPDEVLRALADKGGVIGIEAAPTTTLSEKYPVQGIESFFEHVKYCIDLMGIDHVAFGPDTMYGDHCGIHAVAAEKFSKALQVRTAKEMPKISYVKGLENPTESSNNIVRYLVKSGYSDDDIQKIIGGNVMRVLSDVWHG
jgi:membrane dipeptidase